MSYFDEKLLMCELEEIFEFARRHKRSVMVFGDSGVGKSAVVRRYADKIAPMQDNFRDFRLVLESQESIAGCFIPTEIDGTLTMKRAAPDVWDAPCTVDWEGVILLDELSSAPPSIQAIAYQLLLDRVIGGRKLSDKAVLICCGNKFDNGGLTFELLKPVANRLIQVEVESTGEEALKDWCENFAYEAEVHGAVIGYLHEKSHMLNQNKEAVDATCPAFASQRSWETASLVLHDMDSGKTSSKMGWVTIAGCVGEAAAKDLKAYYNIGHELPSVKSILLGEKPKMPEKHQNKSAQTYLMCNVVTAWKQAFMMPVERYSNDALLEALENALDYFDNDMKSEYGDHKDNLISVGINLNKFMMQKDREFNREGLRGAAVNKSKGYRNLIMEIQKIQAKAKGN